MTSIPLSAYQRQLKIVHYIRSEVEGRLKQESMKEDVETQSDDSDVEDLKEKVKRMDVAIFERILSKDAKKRSQDERDVLLQLLDTVTFLKKFPKSVLVEISEAVRLESFDGFQVVFRQGGEYCRKFGQWFAFACVLWLTNRRNRSWHKILHDPFGFGEGGHSRKRNSGATGSRRLLWRVGSFERPEESRHGHYDGGQSAVFDD